MHTYYVLPLAANGIDYIFMDTTLTFPSNSKPGYVRNITITILSDSIVENTEFFQLRLSYGSPHTIIDKNMGTATVGIHDQTGESSGTSQSLQTPLGFPFYI